MIAIFSANARLAEAMGIEPGQETAALTSLSSRFLALIGLACGLAVVTRLVAEERAGRTALVVAQPRSRSSWLSVAAGWALAQAAVVVVLGGTALGVSMSVATGSAGYVAEALAETAGTVPAVALVVAVGLLAGAIRPVLVPAGWVWFGAIATIALLGDTLRLPTAVRRLSPIEHVSRQAAQGYPVTAGLLLAAAAAVLILFAIRVFRRRDLVAG